MNDYKLKYANLMGYSDITPYEILRKTKNTLIVRQMKAELDPAFTPKYVKGGYAGICINQDEQKWIIESDDLAPEVKAYIRKDGYFYLHGQKMIISKIPMKFYDYNF